jgi:hypothetical protein
MIDMMNTMTVVMIVSRRLGQVTFDTSVRTCCKNSNGFVLAISVLTHEIRSIPPRVKLQYRVRLAVVAKPRPLTVAGVEGLEPPTPGFGDRCSSQLSYTPIVLVVLKPNSTIKPVG